MKKFLKWLAYVIISFICLVAVVGMLTLIAFIVAKLRIIGFFIVMAMTIGTLLFLGDMED